MARSGRMRQLSNQLDKWSKRYFVLIGTELRYFKTDEDYNKGKAALGSLECRGAAFKLKEVAGTAFRFSIISSVHRAPARAIMLAVNLFRLGSERRLSE